jgi:histidine phosphotransferase ChpT
MPHAAPASVPAAVVSRPSVPPADGAAARDFAATRARGLAPDGDLCLAQLLCARICHDLIGAAGAIENGVELLADGVDPAEIHELIGLSGRQLSRRLAYYRHAFGMSGRVGAASSLAEARRLAAAYLEDGRVALCWSGNAGADSRLAAAAVRVLLCAILVAVEGMRRGGRLTVAFDHGEVATSFRIVAEGRDAALPDAVRAALAAEAAAEMMTARTAPAYYLGRLVHHLGGSLEVAAGTGAVTLHITFSYP